MKPCSSRSPSLPPWRFDQLPTTSALVAVVPVGLVTRRAVLAPAELLDLGVEAVGGIAVFRDPFTDGTEDVVRLPHVRRPSLELFSDHPVAAPAGPNGAAALFQVHPVDRAVGRLHVARALGLEDCLEPEPALVLTGAEEASIVV